MGSVNGSLDKCHHFLRRNQYVFISLPVPVSVTIGTRLVVENGFSHSEVEQPDPNPCGKEHGEVRSVAENKTEYM